MYPPLVLTEKDEVECHCLQHSCRLGEEAMMIWVNNGDSYVAANTCSPKDPKDKIIHDGGNFLICEPHLVKKNGLATIAT